MNKAFLISICLVGITLPCLAGIGIPSPYYKSEYCPKERPFTYHGYLYMNQDSCVGCDTFQSIYVKGHEADFEECKDREVVDGYSRLKQCPDNFFRDSKGNCIACDKQQFSIVSNEDDCTVCPNRKVVSVEQRQYTFLHCQLKTCPPEAPLSVGGDCLSCEANVMPDNAKEACEKCPDRIFLPKGYTVFQNDEKKMAVNSDICVSNVISNPDRPLISLLNQITPDDGTVHVYGFVCADCTFEMEYRLRNEVWTERCDKRENVITLPGFCAVCPNREYIDGECVFKQCPDGSINASYYPPGYKDPVVEFHKFQEKCISCVSYAPIYTTKENCHKCPDKAFVESGDSEWGKCLSCYQLEQNPEEETLSSDEESRCPKLKEKKERVMLTLIIDDEVKQK